jgi:hypothetical protein
MVPSVLAVPGVSKLGPAELRKLWTIAERNGWDVDAIATVISLESRWDPAIRTWVAQIDPKQTASGLLQWTESTAQANFGISAAQIRAMDRLQQLDLVETWYLNTLGPGDHRRVDYYIVGLGKNHRVGMDHALIKEGDGKAWDYNKGLDLDGDKAITPRDLDRYMDRLQAGAKGVRIEVPLSPNVPGPAGYSSPPDSEPPPSSGREGGSADE